MRLDRGTSSSCRLLVHKSSVSLQSHKDSEKRAHVDFGVSCTVVEIALLEVWTSQNQVSQLHVLKPDFLFTSNNDSIYIAS